jgi:O-antigen/teichoic acid export membrane protein
MTGINFLTGFIKNKIYSIYLGVSGMGVLSQFTSSVSFLNYLLPLGFPVGITKLIAQYKDKDKSVVQEIIYTTVIVLLLPVFISFLLTFIFAGEVSEFLFDENVYSGYIKVLSVFFPFIVSFALFDAIYKGIGNISLYVKSLILSMVVSLVISVPLVIFFGIGGAIYGLTINYVFFVFYSILKFKKLNVFRFKFSSFKINRDILYELTKIGIAFLVAGALYQLTLLILKKMIIEKYGLDGSGLFQSVLNISLFYFGFIFTSMSSYTFPKISKMENNSSLASELNTTIRFISLIMVPLVLILIVFRYLIVLVLYTSDFLVAEPFFQYQFLGDFFKALSWVLGIWLIPRSKIFFFLLFDIILNVNLIMIFKFILDYTDLGLKGVSFAYLSAYVFHFIINLVLTRKVIGFRFTNKNLKLLISSLAVITGLTYLSFQNLLYGYILFLPVFLGWIFFNLSISEMKEMLGMLKSYMKRYTVKNSQDK